jgi:signal transduction protein with GAF and PtsI domain
MSYCPNCDAVLITMSRIIDAREHDCRVMEGMVKGRDTEIERLTQALDDARVEIEQLTQANNALNRAMLEVFK